MIFIKSENWIKQMHVALLLVTQYTKKKKKWLVIVKEQTAFLILSSNKRVIYIMRFTCEINNFELNARTWVREDVSQEIIYFPC